MSGHVSSDHGSFLSCALGQHCGSYPSHLQTVMLLLSPDRCCGACFARVCMQGTAAQLNETTNEGQRLEDTIWGIGVFAVF